MHLALADASGSARPLPCGACKRGEALHIKAALSRQLLGITDPFLKLEKINCNNFHYLKIQRNKLTADCDYSLWLFLN
jgi:hypothetical protein